MPAKQGRRAYVQAELETSPAPLSVRGPFAKKSLWSFQVHRRLTPAQQQHVPSKATLVCCQSLPATSITQVISSPRPHPAEKVHFYQRGGEGWWEEQKIMEGPMFFSSSTSGQSQDGRTSHQMLAGSGKLWGLPEVIQGQREDWPTSSETDNLYLKTESILNFPI